MSHPPLTFGAFVLILAFGLLLGLALAGVLVDCNVREAAMDAGCVCP